LNLSDLRKSVNAVFGTCAANSFCEGNCNTCLAQAFVEMAWKSGQSSGHQLTADRKRSKVTWWDWNWDQASHNEILQYGNERGLSATQIAFCFEQAKQWAISKNEKRADWLSFMKGWIGREARNNPPPEPQADLFANGSSVSSKTAMRDDARRSTVLSLVTRKDAS